MGESLGDEALADNLAKVRSLAYVNCDRRGRGFPVIIPHAATPV
jgi:hypothetical protein